MSATNSDLQRGFPARAATRDAITLGITVAIGAAGAIAATIGDRGLTIEKQGGDGTYKLLFPKLGTEQLKVTRFRFGVGESALLTFTTVVPTEVFATAASGSITFKTVKADGTAINPAAGDFFWAELVTTSSGTRQ